jgi:hypothetical protein
MSVLQLFTSFETLCIDRIPTAGTAPSQNASSNRMRITLSCCSAALRMGTLHWPALVEQWLHTIGVLSPQEGG